MHRLLDVRALLGNISSLYHDVPKENKHWPLWRLTLRTIWISHWTAFAGSPRPRYLKLLFRSSDNPTTASDFALLTPTLSRSHPGVAVAVNSVTIDIAPNIVIVAQTRPAGPLSPSARDCAAADPTRDVKAATSIRPLPRLNNPRTDAESVTFAIDNAFTMTFEATAG